MKFHKLCSHLVKCIPLRNRFIPFNTEVQHSKIIQTKSLNTPKSTATVVNRMRWPATSQNRAQVTSFSFGLNPLALGCLGDLWSIAWSTTQSSTEQGQVQEPKGTFRVVNGRPNTQTSNCERSQKESQKESHRKEISFKRFLISIVYILLFACLYTWRLAWTGKDT